MKGFIVLAALLLVPTVAYFQTQRFESGLQGDLQERVELVLVEGGVEDAVVRLDWRDARISGLVGSSVQREALAEAVEALEGVRLARDGNQLEVRGWLKLVRKDGVLTVSGLLPKGEDQFLRFIEDVKLQIRDLQGEVSRAEWVAPPAGVMEWNEFVGVFFDGPGNRAVDLRNGRMSIGGEVTPEMRGAWLEAAAAVVGEDEVVDVLTVRSSLREFEGYMPKGIEDAETLHKLREVLGGAVVEFAEGVSEVSEAERAKVSAAAAAMVDLGGTAVFVVEGGGGEGEDVELGRARAVAVKDLLLEYGVREEQVQVVAFEAGAGENPGRRVVLSIK